MKRRIRTILHRCGFAPFAFLLSCSPAQQQQAQSVADRIADTADTRQVVCGAVAQFKDNPKYAEQLKEAAALCDAAASVQDILNTLDTDDVKCTEAK